MDRRFPAVCRLTSRRQYRQVYDRGIRQRARSLTLFAAPNTLESSRVGITATRKIGNAVTRNRAKRLVREAFRRNRDRLVPPMDLVVNVHRGVEETTYTEIERDFLWSFERLTRRDPKA